MVDGNPLVCDCTSSSLQAVLNSSNSWLLPRDLKCAPGSTPGLVGNVLVQVKGFETLHAKPIALPLPLLCMIPDSPHQVAVTSLTCPLNSGCPSPCSCSQGPRVITVDCRKRQLTRCQSSHQLTLSIEELSVELTCLWN